MPNEYFSWYKKNKSMDTKVDPHNLSRFMAEDYITSRGLLNLGEEVDHENYTDYDIKTSKTWHKIIGKRFIVCSSYQLGILNLKYPLSTYIGNSKSLTHVKWKLYAGLKPHILEIISDLIIYRLLKIPYQIIRLYRKIKRLILM